MTFRVLVVERGSYPFAEKQLVYSIAPADWVLVDLSTSPNLHNLSHYRIVRNDIFIMMQSIVPCHSKQKRELTILLNLSRFHFPFFSPLSITFYTSVFYLLSNTLCSFLFFFPSFFQFIFDSFLLPILPFFLFTWVI